jgi:CAAD domains of cyanobacterial aminoacyl-tRNA synthetase
MNTEEKELTQSSLTINSSSSTSLTAKNVSEQLIGFGKQLSATVEVMPSYLDNFWQVYKSFITFLGWIVASIVILKILFAVLGAVNEIPLLSPILELIGIICGGWVAVRYLISAENRAELGRILNSAKQYVFGDR